MKVSQRVKSLIQATVKALGYEIHKTKGCLSALDRISIANIYLSGDGIEIGALHVPLPVLPTARVKYVDKFPTSELRKRYPELSAAELANVDIIDDGELLEKIHDASQDFVIANHFLEHCQDPIGAICSMLRVLKSDGILYMAVPDKRFTFDADRPVTSLEHLLKDYEDHGANSKRGAFEEVVRYIDKIKKSAEVEAEIAKSMNRDDSIHYHAWTQVEILELVLALKKKIDIKFEVELFYKSGIEVITILRKTE